MSVATELPPADHPRLDDLAYSYFQRRVLRLAGIDLGAYKSQQMRRRLGTIMTRNRAGNLFEYARLLEQPDRLQEFLDFFTINVSEFFRIPDKFEYLATHLLPRRLARGGELRVWSAGCSNGAEAYSLAILLNELAPCGRWSILATDVDRKILARAQRGDQYSLADVRNVSPQRLAGFFEKDSAGYRVKESVRRRVQFRVHDLLRDPFESSFGLILCRHVVIYFTDSAKDSLYRGFAASLEDGGVLFVGGTEIIPRSHDIGLESIGVSFYRKAGRAAAEGSKNPFLRPAAGSCSNLVAICPTR